MDDLPEYCTARVLVLGCGNPLVGDDGFGPAVAELLLSEGAGREAQGAVLKAQGTGRKEQGTGEAARSLAPCAVRLAPSICVLNAGTGARTIIFNLATGEPRPKGIIIVDALDAGKRPGELFEPPLESLGLEKAEDFNVHMTPASNMLLKLRELGVEIRLLACQPAPLPGMLRPGLSAAGASAVAPAARRTMEMARVLLAARRA